MTNRSLSILLIGAGSMGSLHARVIAQSRGARLAAIVDPGEHARRLAERYDAEWFGSIDDASALDAFDAVVIAAPTPHHVELAAHVIDAQVPVFVEKPLAEALADVEVLIAQARARSVPLMCGFVERFNPAVMTALAIVEHPVHLRTARHSPRDPRVRGGVAFDLLVHDVDLALQIFGSPPTSLHGRVLRCHPDSAPDAEDVAELLLEFADAAAIASLSASRVSQRKTRSLVITEPDRLIEVDLLRQDVTVYRDVAHSLLDDTPGYRQQTIIDIPMVQPRHEPLAAQLDHFLALVRGEADREAELQGIAMPHALVANLLEAEASRQ